jgi:hypothetical protein
MLDTIHPTAENDLIADRLPNLWVRLSRLRFGGFATISIAIVGNQTFGKLLVELAKPGHPLRVRVSIFFAVV